MTARDSTPAGREAREVPKHVAVIMDGNGRWAQAQRLPRIRGHAVGEERLADCSRYASKVGIKWLTVYGFSTENWKRPPREVSFILGLHKKIFGRRAEMHEHNVRIRWIGLPPDSEDSRMPSHILKEIRKSEEQTKDNTGLQFTVAFDYGGRPELVHAARQAVRREEPGRPVTERDIGDSLWLPEIPDVDLLIRTSGESRISNFLLWRCADSYFHTIPELWPDFTDEVFERSLRWYDEQIRGANPPGST